MRAAIDSGKRSLHVDFTRPMPISICLRHGEDNPVAWYADYPSMQAFQMGDFVGEVIQGGSVNTRDIRFNPHGNGTHTECIGHIRPEADEIDEQLKTYFHLAHLHTVTPERLSQDFSDFVKKGDQRIGLEQLKDLGLASDVKALVIRTLPNDEDKTKRCYTGANPPYFSPEAMHWIREQGIEHLLVDIPSVDREQDGGLMLAHRAFWYDEGEPRMHCTITEMIYVPNDIPDGEYILNLMLAPFGNDASPSKPVLYRIQN